MTSIDTFPDIDDRYIEFDDRVGLDPEWFRAEMHRKQACQKVASELGEQVLTQPQIRALAYLLGFRDPSYSPEGHGPSGITVSAYRSVERRIPRESAIDLSKISHLRSYSGIGFRRSGVQTAFEQLGQLGKVHYTPERFAYALLRLLE